jgi:hypothetical protein
MSQLAWRSVARGGRQRPLAIRRRRHRTAEGGMARATRRDWQAGPSESGARFLWWGAGGREESEAARRRGADLRARPTQCRAAWFKLGLKLVQSYSNGSIEFWIPQNFGWFKRYFPVFQKFEIKYGSKEFEMRNNFAYRNLLRFWMNFELKFRETSMSWTFLKIHWKNLKLWNLMKFD